MDLDSYAYENDGRWYVNPQVSLDEQNAFINNLREVQAQENAQIREQTKNIGTQVPSQLGGLTGGSGYFQARYQTPQVNSLVANLKNAAKLQALQTVMQNEIDKYKKIYNAANRASSLKSSGGSSNISNTRTRQNNDGSSDPYLLKYLESLQEKEYSDAGWSNKSWDQQAEEHNAAVGENGYQYHDYWWLPDWYERGLLTGEWYLGNNKGKG